MADNLWAAGEPNQPNYRDLPCAVTYRDATKFSDTSCNDGRHAYACEAGNYLAATTVDFQ